MYDVLLVNYNRLIKIGVNVCTETLLIIALNLKITNLGMRFCIKSFLDF